MIKCPETKCIYNKNKECNNEKVKECYEKEAYAIVKKCEEYKES